MNRQEDEAYIFWNNFLRALETDPRDTNAIRGASGVEHPVIAVGVDEKRRRLLVICQEIEARSAAMIQADIQSAYRSVRVVVARPLLVSLPQSAPDIFTEKLEADLQANKIWDIILSMETIAYIDKVFKKPSMTAVPDSKDQDWAYMQAFQLQVQLMKIGDAYIRASKEQVPEKKKEFLESKTRLLSNALNLDPSKQDRQVGICPIPLYDFTTEERVRD